MQTLLNKALNSGSNSTNISVAILILRIAGGAFMLTHGLGKFEALFSGEPIQFRDPIGVGATASLALAVFSEVLCAVLLIVGLGTRLAAIPLAITMFVAAFIVHATDGFGRQELPLLYAAVYISIALIGAGKYSLDNWLLKK
ncbi:DoxX family protein [Oceanihabitans sediminis]|uniref:DoxX family protein n=1 Tax=Oceanihabitans sediminis TaxID=1812012 RepID=A0A368P197_9FLAO|nr:DoxX family protein [Oceanihabitans sediminis]MDX1279062.1 DoxX family protein [Oceanihabitans sediminis]MDX1774690.1 DoxX family protein [Oceanihabitans sediminis]RBP28429.1 putative oxidoreductase [Oceanihabitans sediminis]RCU56627.1 DoxX family protein [Oceanihabitans sediminis]